MPATALCCSPALLASTSQLVFCTPSAVVCACASNSPPNVPTTRSSSLSTVLCASPSFACDCCALWLSPPSSSLDASSACSGCLAVAIEGAACAACVSSITAAASTCGSSDAIICCTCASSC